MKFSNMVIPSRYYPILFTLPNPNTFGTCIIQCLHFPTPIHLAPASSNVYTSQPQYIWHLHHPMFTLPNPNTFGTCIIQCLHFPTPIHLVHHPMHGLFEYMHSQFHVDALHYCSLDHNTLFTSIRPSNTLVNFLYSKI